MRGLLGLSSKATITRTIGKRDFTLESLTIVVDFLGKVGARYIH